MKLNLVQLREQAEQLRAAGEHLATIRIYLAILRRSPQDYETRLHLAEALERVEAVAEAVKVYEAVAKHCVTCGRPLVAIVACRAMEARGKRAEHLLLELASRYGKDPARKKGATGLYARVAQQEALVDAKELRRECTVAELVADAVEVGAQLGGLDEQAIRYVSVPLLSALTPPTLVKVIRAALVHRLPAGHVVFRQGEEGKSCYLVARGSVRVQISGPGGGDQVEVANLSDGAIFGEMSLITGAARSATVEVTEETDLLELGPAALAAIGEELAQVAQALDRLAERRWMANLMSRSPVFAAFNEGERLDLLRRFQAHEMAASAMLVEQGERAQGIFLLLRGEVMLVQKGGEAPVRTKLGPGATIGLESIVHDAPSRHKATTVTPCTVLFMPAKRVVRLIEAIPEFAQAVRKSAPPS